MYPIGTKLGVGKVPCVHVGRYMGNGKVFHNHWKNDAEIITFNQFANDKKVKVLDQGVQSPQEFTRRVQHLLALNKPYCPLSNNCEHAASYVSGGVASSPQLVFYGSLIALASVFVLSQSARA